MKRYTYLLLCLGVFALLFSACKDDDDNGNGNGGETTNACCQIPHLEACIGGGKVFVPNAFTPNGDGINDIFYPFTGIGIKEITSFKIFNENGTIIFEANNFRGNDPTRSWDGSLFDGTIANGVYAYSIDITNLKDETQFFDGSVCVRSGFDPLPCVDFEKHCAYGNQYNPFTEEFNAFVTSDEVCQ